MILDCVITKIEFDFRACEKIAYTRPVFVNNGWKLKEIENFKFTEDLFVNHYLKLGEVEKLIRVRFRFPIFSGGLIKTKEIYKLWSYVLKKPELSLNHLYNLVKIKNVKVKINIKNDASLLDVEKDGEIGQVSFVYK